MDLVFLKPSERVFKVRCEILKEFLSFSTQPFDYESPKYCTLKYENFSDIRVDKGFDKSTKFRQQHLVNNI